MRDQTSASHRQRKLAVITGASSGIGLELAKNFALHDYDLVIAAEDAGIFRAQQQLVEFGAEVQAIRLNLATYDAVETLYQEILATGRPVDALAVNAGVGGGGDFATQTDFMEELNLINLNVVSAVHLTKRVVRDMVLRGQGRVLFTSSVAATMPGPYYAVYAASKAFLQSFSQALRIELEGTGVSTTALMPGATATRFFVRAGLTASKAGEGSKDDPAEVARQGFEALMSGKDHVVGGSFKNRLQVSIAKFLPESLGGHLHGAMIKPEHLDHGAHGGIDFRRDAQNLHVSTRILASQSQDRQH